MWDKDFKEKLGRENPLMEILAFMAIGIKTLSSEKKQFERKRVLKRTMRWRMDEEDNDGE